MKILIRGGLIVTPEGKGVRAERGTIVVEGDRIARVTYGAEAARVEAGAGDRVIDASQHLVIPGLVDAHSHLWGTLLPVVLDHLPLEVRVPLTGALTRGWSDREVRVATLLAALRMLRGGTTTVLENVLQGIEATEPTARALLDAGMRAIVGPSVADRPFHVTLPGYLERLPHPLRSQVLAASVPRAHELVEACRAIARRWHGAGGRIQVCLSPWMPNGCSEALLTQMAEAAETDRLPIHTHLLETRVQAVVARRLYGRTMVDHLRALGLLGARLSCAHAVYLTDGDIDLLAEAGVGVSHNPLSNLYFGSGVARVPEMLRRGIAVGIGSDGPSCGSSTPLFEVMKLAAVVHRVGEADGERWVSVRDAFRMATIGGARALGLDQEIGSIEVGKKGDLVLLDAEAPNFVPLNDPVAQLVYWETGRAVDTVLVNGEVVLEGGRPTRFDAGALLAEARELGPLLRERSRPGLDQARCLEPYLRGAYRELLRDFDGLKPER
jgi:cytosine/adenosine deaminase-related metal-dependent hydrolase